MALLLYILGSVGYSPSLTLSIQHSFSVLATFIVLFFVYFGIMDVATSIPSMHPVMMIKPCCQGD